MNILINYEYFNDVFILIRVTVAYMYRAVSQELNPTRKHGYHAAKCTSVCSEEEICAFAFQNVRRRETRGLGLYVFVYMDWEGYVWFVFMNGGGRKA